MWISWFWAFGVGLTSMVGCFVCFSVGGLVVSGSFGVVWWRCFGLVGLGFLDLVLLDV